MAAVTKEPVVCSHTDLVTVTCVSHVASQSPSFLHKLELCSPSHGHIHAFPVVFVAQYLTHPESLQDHHPLFKGMEMESQSLKWPMVSQEFG